jgi:hypothetical protein
MLAPSVAPDSIQAPGRRFRAASAPSELAGAAVACALQSPTRLVCSLWWLVAPLADVDSHLVTGPDQRQPQVRLSAGSPGAHLPLHTQQIDRAAPA